MTFLSPYRTDKNIGRAYNEACADAPSGWICITDYDAMFLLPEAKKEIINWTEQYDVLYPIDDILLGCMTNRLNPGLCSQQLYKSVCSNESDILAHRFIAEKLLLNPIILRANTVAGVCMVFKKSTWARHRFKENNLNFDQAFSNDIRTDGGKLGIMSNVYIFHYYRLHAAHPINDTKHLKS